MSNQRASLEVIAPTIEEAVANGLEELGLSEEAVDVEILDSGSKGLFGLGSRQARVRLTIRDESSPPRVPVGEKPSQAALSETPDAAPAQPVEQAVVPQDNGVQSQPVAPEAAAAAVSEEDEHALEVARETVKDLLDRMKVRATVTAHFAEPDEPQSRAPLLVDVRGKDLSILIGPRAETLNALQYVAGLIVGKELGRSLPLVVDVEGYRQRREQQIRQLARRMADQAIKTGRRQILEPMPANERRLIHIELRNNPDVTTQSVGEEPRRKVTINPEK